jgi:hypothetical protein
MTSTTRHTCEWCHRKNREIVFRAWVADSSTPLRYCADCEPAARKHIDELNWCPRMGFYVLIVFVAVHLVGFYLGRFVPGNEGWHWTRS